VLYLTRYIFAVIFVVTMVTDRQTDAYGKHEVYYLLGYAEQ